MAQHSDPNERFEGIDRSVLDEDVWTEAVPKTTCPKCGLAVDAGTIRCPRCHALTLMACGGSCASCGSRTCVRCEERS